MIHFSFRGIGLNEIVFDVGLGIGSVTLRLVSGLETWFERGLVLHKPLFIRKKSGFQMRL